jgi:methylenetetrahydrofolate dehydrogenase (NADP+)/methenyltetrahydrofolate cyclohydrolase/formyltetrahydrofolate synthetase
MLTYIATDTSQYVFISPHAENGETFVFIKKHTAGLDAPFVVGFEGEPVHSNLEDASEASTPNSSHSDTVTDELDVYKLSAPDQLMQHVPRNPEEPVAFQWATANKSGRPHGADTWEVDLKKGDKIKVIRDMGRDWFVVIDRKGIQGYVHGSWIQFGDRTVHKDSKAAYIQFQQDIQKLLKPSQLQHFPAMTSYIDECTKLDCQSLKESVSSLGICVHDLLALLQGSGKYSYEWLKEARNLWHPDRFARFCHSDQVEDLKLKAEQMFVMYGILMEASKV